MHANFTQFLKILAVAAIPMLAKSADIKHELVTTPRKIQVGNHDADLRATVSLYRQDSRVIVNGQLNYTGTFSRTSPTISRLWLLVGDDAIELKFDPVAYEGMKSLRFNAVYGKPYPAGTRTSVVIEVSFEDGIVRRLRSSNGCVDVTTYGDMKPELGDRDCY